MQGETVPTIIGEWSTDILSLSQIVEQVLLYFGPYIMMSDYGFGYCVPSAVYADWKGLVVLKELTIDYYVCGEYTWEAYYLLKQLSLKKETY